MAILIKKESQPSRAPIGQYRVDMASLVNTNKFSVFSQHDEVPPAPRTPTKAQNNKEGDSSSLARPTKTPPVRTGPTVTEPIAMQSLDDVDDKKEKKEQVVDPWTVESEGAIDYDRLIHTFGSQRLGEDLIERMER
eukprot:gene41275-50376_t